MSNDYAERVARGIGVLDRLQPEWRTLIDANRLNIGDSEDCIIGQLFGSWANGCDVLAEEFSILLDRPYAVAHGFDVTSDEFLDEVDHYALLTDAWLEALNA